MTTGTVWSCILVITKDKTKSLPKKQLEALKFAGIIAYF
jgi:hypothetical protein